MVDTYIDDIDRIDNRVTLPKNVTPAYTPSVSPTAVSPTTPNISNNITALRGLYGEVFDRAPDQEGFNFWIDAMNNRGYTPEMVRNEFLQSPEYQAKQQPATPSTTATQAALAPLTLDASVYNMNPTQKAGYYNTLLGKGYSDAQIRAAAGNQTDADWSALQGLAAGLQPTSGGFNRSSGFDEMQMAHGGSVHSLAKKYAVGGAVKGFQSGGLNMDEALRRQMSVAGVQDPFAAGRALNEKYGTTFQQDTGIGLPDLRPFGDRYAAELASIGGRRNFGRDIGYAQAELRPQGIYKAGDFDMLPGLSFDDPWTKANYWNLFQQGNSYFIPDKIEADAHLYALHSPMAQRQTKEQQDKLFNEMYYGGRLANTAQGVQNPLTGAFGPEAVTRGLLNYRAANKPVELHMGSPYYNARGVLAGMDVGRGALTPEQGDALNRAVEFKYYRDNQAQALDAATNAGHNEADLAKMREGLQSYQRAFDDYMAKVNTIDPTLADLSSIDIIRRLRGEEPPKAARGGVMKLAQKYAEGGAVKRFQVGGNEGEDDERTGTRSFPVREPQIESREMPMGQPRAAAADPMAGVRPIAAYPVTASPAVQPVTPPPAATTPVSPAATDLMSMLQRYTSAESPYAADLAKARTKLDTESKAFENLLASAMKPGGSAPDKTELYFRLAAAFGSPSKTGRFTENLALAGREAAEYTKDVRAAKKAEQQLGLQLGLEAQKLRMQGAREELTALRAMAGEEMKDKRAVLLEYLKSGRPQSEAGKAAVDAGLTQGTPEFTNFVNKYIEDKIGTGNMLKEAMVAIAAEGLKVKQSAEERAKESSKKLTPGELKLKTETEQAIGSLDDAMGTLKRAYALNPQTFEGTLIDVGRRKLLEQTDPKDPRVLATREQANLLGKGAIEKLKASFGGNPTEGERAALMQLEGLDAKSKEERALIMKNTYKLLQQRRAREQKRLNEISQGLYRETTPSAGEIE